MTAAVSLVLFAAVGVTSHSILSYGFPYEPKDTCQKISLEDIPESLRYAPQRQSDLLLKTVVPTLATFDEILPAQTICLSRDIGINALAGVFLLFGLLVLSNAKDRARLRDFAPFLLCVLLIASLDSRATVALGIVAISWLAFVAALSRFSPKQVLSSLVIGLVLTAALALNSDGVDKVTEAAWSEGRMKIYQQTVDQIAMSPWLGHGLGAKVQMDGYHVYPHNFLASSWLMMGLAGLVSAVALLSVLAMAVAASARRVLDRNKSSALSQAVIPLLLLSPVVTLLIRSSVESIFMLSDWISVAVFIALYAREGEQKETAS